MVAEQKGNRKKSAQPFSSAAICAPEMGLILEKVWFLPVFILEKMCNICWIVSSKKCNFEWQCVKNQRLM